MLAPPARTHRLLVSIGATLLAAVPLAFILVGILLLPGSSHESTGFELAAVFVIAAPAVMGWTIEHRRPGHPIGWLLLVHAAILTVWTAARPSRSG